MRPVPSERASEEMVLGFLVEGGDDFSSGEALSDKLGLSGAAVWKNIESLRSQGYDIEAVAGRGYRLVGVPDRLTPLELGPLVSTHDIGRTVHFHEVVPSTSDIAFQLANDGALHGEVVIAEQQTRGRGRRGRTWVSPPGKNLYLSVILRPDLPPQDAPQITFVAAVALAETVREAGCESWLKWPNDVEIGTRKVGGILTELSAEPGRVNFVVVGIGVNLNARAEDFPAELRDRATSILMERGSRVPRALFAAALCAKTEAWYDSLMEQGFDAILDRWRELTSTIGMRLRVAIGDRTVVGVAEDVAPNGALLVRGDDGKIHHVVAGDVEHLEAQ